MLPSPYETSPNRTTSSSRIDALFCSLFVSASTNEMLYVSKIDFFSIG